MSADKEYLDIFDSLGQPIGKATRAGAHASGLWHRTVHCWIVFRDPMGRGRVVLQKRSETKSSWPGYFDITAAGHLLAGETLEDGLREIEEEIGIEPDPSRLISLGTRVCVEDFKPGVVNREFQAVYLLVDDRPLADYRMQLEELAGLVAPRIDELLQLFRGERSTVTADGIRARLSEGRAIEQCQFEITPDLFIPSLDAYNHKVMLLAERALEGFTDLLI